MLNKIALESELRSYWKNEKMVNHCMKHSKYIQLGEWFVDCCELKPTITKDIYYDDETADPGTSKAIFLAHNTPIRTFTDDRKYYLIKHYCSQTNQKLASIITCRTWEEPTLKTIKEVEPEELQAINEAIEEVNVNYAKRLETYFKRYAGKIRTHGYWANR